MRRYGRSPGATVAGAPTTPAVAVPAAAAQRSPTAPAPEQPNCDGALGSTNDSLLGAGKDAAGGSVPPPPAAATPMAPSWWHHADAPSTTAGATPRALSPEAAPTPTAAFSSASAAGAGMKRAWPFASPAGLGGVAAQPARRRLSPPRGLHAAAASGTASAAPSAAARAHRAAALIAAAAKPPAQTYLDLGQRCMDSATCGACGMVWTPGVREEERLHAAQCQRAGRGALSLDYPAGGPGEVVVRTLHIPARLPAPGSSATPPARFKGAPPASSQPPPVPVSVAARVVMVPAEGDGGGGGGGGGGGLRAKIAEVRALLARVLGEASDPEHAMAVGRSCAAAAGGANGRDGYDASQPALESAAEGSGAGGDGATFGEGRDGVVGGAGEGAPARGATPGAPSGVIRWLCVAGGQVAGVLVTQTLSHAYRAAVAAPSVGPAGAPPGPRQLVMDTSAAVPARLGVAQVWVHPDFRGGGVATALLDAALSHAVYAARLTAEQLAFSAPTAAGEGLARAYLRRARGAQAGGAVDEEPALLVYA